MQLTITGKQIDTGAALRQHVETGLSAILERYFGAAIEAHVVLAREAHLTRCDLSVHVGRGIDVNAGAAAAEPYAAFDTAAERVAKQLRRYKRWLRGHHGKVKEPVEQATDYVLAPVADEPEDREDAATTGRDGGSPAVIAEMRTDLPHLTVGEAAMRLDLADAPVLLFRNRSHGELNLVYRRPDGHIGWIDPELDPARRSPRREA